MVREAKNTGVRKILVTHPDLNLSGISTEVQKALAAEGLRIFIQMLLERGITAEEIHTMVAENPARLLGLA